MDMQRAGEATERLSAPCPRAQGLSRRAHAFSVEALVGKSCKRVKVESLKDGRIETLPISDSDSETSTGTAVAERKGQASETEERAAEDKTEPDTQIRVELQGSDLWNRFHEIGTEMIITKAGRRMFPSIRVKVRNLDPFKQYYIALDIMLVDSKRYRYVYHSSQWMVAGNTDQSCVRQRLYVHPDSPCSGETWMRQVISFDRVKLTNNEMDDKGHIILQSMHKYKPRVHVVVHDHCMDVSQISTLPSEGVSTFSFPETQFTTVTAYQNQQITKLKIDRNPFAKGFRDPGRNRAVLDGILEPYPWRSPFGLDVKPFTLELQGVPSFKGKIILSHHMCFMSWCGRLFASAFQSLEFIWDKRAGQQTKGMHSADTCGGVLPLKTLLPPSISNVFPVSNSEASLHHLTVPLCYKLSHSNHVMSRSYCGLVPDRLCAYPGLRPLDFPLLSPLHGKKTGVCRGPCLHSHCLFPIQNLQAEQASGTQQTSPLIPSYNLYSYSLPISSSKPSDSTSLGSSENLLRPSAWRSTLNHWL